MCQGQVVGAILAETKAQAQRAAKCVKIDYEELEPIITIKVLSVYEPHQEKAWPEVINLFSCSTQLSMKFEQVIKSKMMEKINIFLAIKPSDVVFTLLINVKMPSTVCILILMSRIKLMLN